MKSKASPRQVMNIIDLTEKEIWKNYGSYDKVLSYINRWQEHIWDVNNTGWNGFDGINFKIIYKDQNKLSFCYSFNVSQFARKEMQK